ncbi:MAG: helix-turn-helix domain-containing protein [Cyclobacteriaceae bacterium]|nr:helix-turn-helix domain-containing protein [Cyclobacteriaceae bacterium SS2]
MQHVSILVPRGQYSIVNIGGAFQILNWASDMFFNQSRQPLFQVELVGIGTPSPDADGFYTITPQKTLDQIKRTDLIIVPAVHGNLEQVMKENRPLMEWVVSQHRQGAEVASMCIGAFLLASVGLLDGKKCSTHWGHAGELAESFPNVQVVAENIVIESGGIYTCGGAYAFTNLLVYLIEKYGGRELAVITAKSYMIDIDRGSQSPFTIFVGQKSHQDETVLKIQQEIECNFSTAVTIETLAAQHAITRRTLERRFKKATGNSILEYLQRVRIEAAKRKLESGSFQVNETMYSVGYSDPKSFREIFKKFVGLTPVEYSQKYTKRVA